MTGAQGAPASLGSHRSTVHRDKLERPIAYRLYPKVRMTEYFSSMFEETIHCTLAYLIGFRANEPERLMKITLVASNNCIPCN